MVNFSFLPLTFLVLCRVCIVTSFHLLPTTPRVGLKTLQSARGTIPITPTEAPSKPKNIKISVSRSVEVNDDPSVENDRLELDESGTLRIDGQHVLLEGLAPDVWTSITPKCDEESSSLFLKTKHSKESAQHEVTLGNLVTFRGLLACARLTRYWMGPAFGTSTSDIPLDTQFLLVEIEKDGQYALFLPLVDDGFRASLEYGGKNNEIKVVCYSESGDACTTSEAGMRTLYVAVGSDPFALLKKGFQQVSDTTGTFRTLSQKQIPKTVDDFGWCTWDAFYSEVHPTGILEGVKALKELGIPPRNVIIDDGWQEVSPKPDEWNSMKTETSKSTVLSVIGGALFSVIAKVVTLFYEVCVKKSEHGSFSTRLWTMLSKTVLKEGLRKHFDTTTDFGRQLSTFEPNFKFQTKSADSQGDHLSMADLIHELKEDLGVKRVYCWHALHGYWRGVTTELGRSIGINVTQIHTQPIDHLLRVEPQMAFDTPSLFGVGMITDKEDIATFYEHLHKPLVSAGVDGVKVDVQSGVSAAGSGVGGGPKLARVYTETMEESVSKNFRSDGDGAIECINCMAHSTENLYRYKTTAIARASDDFYPDRPESHTVHLVNVAYNSLFLGEICLPDWDMFQSQHESAPLHAAARAVGGCPVYVSDVPGSHNASLLKKLVLPDGSILRAELPGRPCRDTLFADVGRDGNSALKIWNKNSGGSGVVGAFNVQGVVWNFLTNENEVVEPTPGSVTAKIKPLDVESLRDSDSSFVLWSHTRQSIELLSTEDSAYEIELRPKEWEIATIVPIANRGEVQWAPIGLSDMLNSGGAIVGSSPLERSFIRWDRSKEGTTTTSITTRGPGRFVAFCRPAPVSIMIGDSGVIPEETPFNYDEESGLLSFVLKDERSAGIPHQVTIVWKEANST